MNRVELIASLAKRKGEETAHKPRGMAHPGEQAIAKAKDRKRGLGVLLRGNWGAMERPRGLRCGWVHEPDSREPVERVAVRHQAHHLNRIAERLKRGWNR